MIFGIHSLLFRETFTENDLPLLDRVKQMGFDAIEIIPFDVEKFPAKKVRQAAADLGLIVNTGFGMPERYNIISPDPFVRRAGVEFSKRLIDVSNDAGARVFGGMIYCGWGYLTGRAAPTMSGSGAWRITERSHRMRNTFPNSSSASSR